MRACLPVSDRERIVSADVAARNFSFTTGWVSASSVVSHTDPHHTPCAPSAIAAAIWRPRPMPPAPSTGMSTASTISGISTIEPISPVCPPASEPWAMIRSTPAAWWRSACCGRPGERADQPALLLHPVDQELRRRAERVGDEGGPVGQRDLELRSGRVGAERRVAVVAGDRRCPIGCRRRRAARAPRSGRGCRRRTPGACRG